MNFQNQGEWEPCIIVHFFLLFWGQDHFWLGIYFDCGKFSAFGWNLTVFLSYWSQVCIIQSFPVPVICLFFLDFQRPDENFHGLFSNNQLQLQNLSIKLKDISQNLQYSAFFPCFSLNVWEILFVCSLDNYLNPTELDRLVVLWLSRWAVTSSGLQD